MTEQQLAQDLAEKIAHIDSVANELPCVVIIHNIRELNLEYMSPKGLAQLGTTLENLRSMGAEYHARFFNPEDVADYLPKLQQLLLNNDQDEQLSFFQQVKFKDKENWTWHISSVKILMNGCDGKPQYTITLAIPIDTMKHVEAKAEKLMQENTFLRKNYQQFLSLTKRERDILKLVALGHSSPEIAAILHIAPLTVETHRKNLKKKLGGGGHFEMTQYARAFDLI